MTQNFREKYIAPKEFYRKTLRITIPIALQNMLSGTMAIIDSIMVSWIDQMTAVGTASQIDTLCGMINYGAIGGIGMFAAQFFGAKDDLKLKKAFGMSLIFAALNGLLWLLLALLGGRQILAFYMDDAATVNTALIYLSVSMFAYPLNGINFAFSNIYRCIQRQDISLKVSLFAGSINIVLNYLLIFGVGPFPELGVIGAALGTVIAQLLSVSVYIFHAVSTRQPFWGSFGEMFRLEHKFVKTVIWKIAPLVLNETVFGFGSTLFIKAFGHLGTASMNAYYVGNQINNMFQFVVYGYGSAVSILLGATLGQGKIEAAKRDCDYFIASSFVLSIGLVIIMFIFTIPMVALFDLQDPFVWNMAVWIVRVFAFKVSMRLFNFMIFSILRSGGDSKIIPVLDCGIMWLVGIPLAFVCVDWLGITNIAVVLLIVQVEQLIRLIIGMRRVKSGVWANDLTAIV